MPAKAANSRRFAGHNFLVIKKLQAKTIFFELRRRKIAFFPGFFLTWRGGFWDAKGLCDTKRS
jgi:hypothetical protein